MEESEILLGGGIFLPGEGNLRRRNFDNLNLFISLKQLSVHTEHQLKSKLTRSKCPKDMTVKQKWNKNNDYS